MPADTRPFRYLNENGVWPHFHWRGLVLGSDGALRLPALPACDESSALAALKASNAPAGVAADAAGAVYFTDPEQAAIWRIEGCFGTLEHAACIEVKGAAGLALSPRRHALYVAHPRHGKVDIFDLETMALAEVLDDFATPLGLALDDAGNLYVADQGAGRVEMVSASGDRLTAFGDLVQASGHAGDPGALACEAGLVYVLDYTSAEVCVYAPDALREVVATGIADARAFTVVDAILYVADPARRRITVWQRAQSGRYEYSGDAAGYDGPVAALAPDGAGGLLASAGGGLAPLRLRLGASHASAGWLWSDAIVVGTRAHVWNRLNAAVDLPAGSHVRFHAYTGSTAIPPPAPLADGSFPPPWRSIGSDISNFYIDLHGTPAEALWLGAQFGSELHTTPALSQAMLDYDQSSYLQELPAIYRPAPEDGNFLLRYLSLFESMFDDLEDKLNGLAALLDPAAAPAGALPWLASWLALALPEAQSAAAQRPAISGAYARYGRRGTAAGLREVLHAEAGVDARIDEPLQSMGWWGLPAIDSSCKEGASGRWTDGDDSILGFNTVLAQAEYQGAVLGSTATLDQSQLLTAEQFGAPIFEAAAYRFSVRLYPAQVQCAGKLEQVRAIIEREKPAHTLYELGVIDTGLRVGFQATLGVDTLLGTGAAQPSGLGEGALILGGAARGSLGIDSRVGAGAQL